MGCAAEVQRDPAWSEAGDVSGERVGVSGHVARRAMGRWDHRVSAAMGFSPICERRPPRLAPAEPPRSRSGPTTTAAVPRASRDGAVTAAGEDAGALVRGPVVCGSPRVARGARDAQRPPDERVRRRRAWRPTRSPLFFKRPTLKMSSSFFNLQFFKRVLRLRA